MREDLAFRVVLIASNGVKPFGVRGENVGVEGHFLCRKFIGDWGLLNS